MAKDIVRVTILSCWPDQMSSQHERLAEPAARPAVPTRSPSAWTTTISPSQRHRTIWISDIHLGTPGCKAEFLLDFLKWNDADTLYPGRRHPRRLATAQGLALAAGAQRRGPEAPAQGAQGHARGVRAGQPRRVRARTTSSHAFGGIEVVHEAVHRTADGKRLLVTHGDLFDGVVQQARWLALLGDQLYTLILALNHWFNRARARLGFGYWSLSQYLKHKAKARGVLHHRFRAGAGPRGAAPRPRRRRLRAHPQGGDSHGRRHAVLQRRRLGREPDRAGRGPRRPAAAGRMEGDPAEHAGARSGAAT